MGNSLILIGGRARMVDVSEKPKTTGRLPRRVGCSCVRNPEKIRRGRSSREMCSRWPRPRESWEQEYPDLVPMFHPLLIPA